jgi:hypothetical protein
VVANHSYKGLVPYGKWAADRGIPTSTAYWRARNGLVPGLVRLGSRYYLPKQVVEALDSGDLVLLSIMKGAGNGS